ncbi:hypothetical protein [Oceanobacillus polygoni]|uniref:GGDEF domain-containing protein n=1 Tax=Oceanobacillus polygoni TaxID=1235259 RepID=A0A9X0YUB0_9BACI|nr:hypothetical protein [Oceanobacillus polygoni]MBP2078843.1 hypothetical protein [Oceanobacillus polygoni]
MKVRIGVIGPTDSVQQIMSVAKEFSDTSIVPFTYESLEEIDRILERNKDQFDQWFFSGIMNFSYAMDHALLPIDKAIYPNMNGSTFFGTLLEAQLEGNTVYKKISIDTIKREEIEKILAYYKLDAITYNNMPFQGYEHNEKQIAFHQNLYEQGEMELAITFLRATYIALKEKGIPVYRVTPSYLSIEQSFRLLIERALSTRYKNAQMAVIGCKVEFNTSEEALYYSFKMKHKELELRQSLLHLTEKVNGSLMQLGDGLFFIFTTRGEIDHRFEAAIFELIEDVKIQENIQLTISIGFGETVSQAEQHVRKGFHNLEKEETTSIIIVDEDQNMTKKNSNNETIAYKTIEMGAEWKAKIQHSGVSPGVVSKLRSYTRQYNRYEFTSSDVSRWLKSTERNGRRIANLLEKAGITVQCGELQSGVRGRPRKVFRFKE